MVPSSPSLGFLQSWRSPLFSFLAPSDQGVVLLTAFASQTDLLCFTLIAVYFPTLAAGGFWFLLLITLLAPLLGEILPSLLLTDVKEVKQYLLEKDILNQWLWAGYAIP